MDSIPIRVYYEDTDLAGIVYYANYLKFIERGRTEYLRSRGVEQSVLKEAGDTVFAASRVEADYLSPAKFDELLTVTTCLETIKGARVVMDQQVLCGDRLLFRAQVTLACTTVDGRPKRVPANLRALLATGVE